MYISRNRMKAFQKEFERSKDFAKAIQAAMAVQNETPDEAKAMTEAFRKQCGNYADLQRYVKKPCNLVNFT